MTYSEKAAAVTAIFEQMVTRADRTTRLKAALDLLAKMDLGAEITDDSDGTIIYIPRKR